MAHKPAHPCGYPGCPDLTETRFCTRHAQRYEVHRGTRQARGYDDVWLRFRNNFIEHRIITDPLCAGCQKPFASKSDIQVDHIIPLRERPDLKYEGSNLQLLCRRCHFEKTNKEGRAI